MNRADKIKLLQAIEQGKATIEDIEPPQAFIFTQSNLNPNVYEMNGKKYPEQEYKDFCKKVARRNDNSIIWSEVKTY